jgi:hypothetical protein
MYKLLILLLYTFIFVTAWPVARLLRGLCKDELVQDRKYVLYLSYLLLFAAVFLIFFYYNSSMVFSLVYLVIVLALMILIKDKN